MCGVFCFEEVGQEGPALAALRAAAARRQKRGVRVRMLPDGEILQGREIEDAVEHERARGRGFGAGVADGRDVPADRGTARLVRRDAIHEAFRLSL